ncbi:hypothetical protein [Leifsonia sp. NPDC058248]|uniref:hypothetical protein n=1 Tax=Leifsonia sp. NPDC058248 TaxID=3346402 RepID=UPI0036D7DF39
MTVILGSVTAAWLFHDFAWALAGFVGAALAPTDAALSSQVINDEALPMSVRRALNASFALTITIDGNGFVAAFAAGITFGSALPRRLPNRDTLAELPELGGELLALVVWFFF